jgi:hypothetical protein
MTIEYVDWRSKVKRWNVEPFFGKWIVVADDGDSYCYISRWRWLAVLKSKRLTAKYITPNNPIRIDTL